MHVGFLAYPFLWDQRNGPPRPILWSSCHGIRTVNGGEPWILEDPPRYPLGHRAEPGGRPFY